MSVRNPTTRTTTAVQKVYRGPLHTSPINPIEPNQPPVQWINRFVAGRPGLPRRAGAGLAGRRVSPSRAGHDPLLASKPRTITGVTNILPLT
jgi:hypothetical protein